MDLFNKDGTLNEKALDDRSKLQIEADFAVLVAEYDQALSARRDVKAKGDAGDSSQLVSLANKVDHLRTFMINRAVEAGERPAGATVNGG